MDGNIRCNPSTGYTAERYIFYRAPRLSETQTFSSPCHSTGTQANPQTASASTGTGPRQAALGARNALQENSR